MIIIAVIAVIVVLLLIWGAAAYNGLISGKNQCKEAFSTMDVYLKKRFDLIPNLVSITKGYAKHETETLEKVIRLRNQVSANADISEKVKTEDQISGALRPFFALGENYPDLKANQNFLNLSDQLKSVETDIANSRKYYNGCVREYNNRCMMVPSNIIAGIFHFQPYSMFEVDTEDQRENIKVTF